jgi:exodeoxyribonuclease VII large subunit
MLEERKRKLAAEGLFDSEHKKPIPVYPSRIAVVTSPTGAAIRDILNVLERRQAAPNVVILPASVQGAEAPAQIAAQIQRADRYGLGEVILVGRGGGSLEDLLAFSDEGVVRAVYAAHTPVISCVGHEIDWALSDYVADLRAPTPSAAAELVSARRDDLLAHTGELRRQLVEGMQRRIEAVRVSLRQFSPENLQRSVRYLLDPLMLRLDDLKENLVARMERYVADRKHTVALAASQIESRSPFDVLKRGYAIVRRDSDGGILRGPAEVSIGEAIRAELAEGSLRAKIIDSKSSDS